MPHPLLTTRLHPPPIRPDAVFRPRLVDRLEEAVAQGVVVLLSAPAGAGKTSLLASWAGAARRPVAWLSLAAGDEDPARLLAYVVEALRVGLEDPTLGAEALSTLESAGASVAPSPAERAMTVLINELQRRESQVVLVLDDHHLLDGAPVWAPLRLLVERRPSSLAIVLSGRSDPPLPLARLRLAGSSAELRAADLCFSEVEARSLFATTSARAIADETLRTLLDRTEGWAAGLQAAALAMRDQGGEGDPTALLLGFSGRHPFVLDYLIDEVLDRQPADLRRFLLCTSVLDRLCAPLCAVLLDESVDPAQTAGPAVSAAALMLEHLEHANLFLHAVDEERRWYRYHALFADLLRHRLRRESPAAVPALHRRAMAWYDARGDEASAIEQALSAGDLPAAAERIASAATGLALRKEARTLRRWLEALPPDWLTARPRLAVARAWLALQSESMAEAERWLTRAEAALPEEEHGPQDERVAGEIAAIRAQIASVGGDVPATVRFGALALRQLGEAPEDLALRIAVAGSRASALSMAGHISRAAEAYVETARLARGARDSAMAVGTLCTLAELRRLEGRLHEAGERAREAIERATRSGQPPLAAAGRAHLVLAAIARERGDLEEAVAQADRGRALAARGGNRTSEVIAALQQALNHEAAGASERASAALSEALAIVRATGASEAVLANFATTEAWFHHAAGRVEAVGAWAEDYRATREGLSVVGRGGDLLLARLACEAGRPAEAESLLEPLAASARERGSLHAWLRTQVVRALASDQRGARDEAVTMLVEALSLGAEQGHHATFVAEGEPIVPLLRLAAARGAPSDYVGGLLAAIERGSRATDGATDSRDPSAPASKEVLLEPLSAREMEVLRLVAAGLANREVAEALSIALATVKRHLTNIYGKLGVDSRTRAVARARRLGLLGGNGL